MENLSIRGYPVLLVILLVSAVLCALSINVG